MRFRAACHRSGKGWPDRGRDSESRGNGSLAAKSWAIWTEYSPDSVLCYRVMLCLGRSQRMRLLQYVSESN